MPLTEDFQAKIGGEYKAVPADVYQIVLQDVELKKNQPKYKDPNTLVTQLLFKCQVLSEDENGHKLAFFTSDKWFAGGQSASPSKLFLVAKAVWDFYSPKSDILALKDSDINMAFINDLLNKQIRVTVAVTEQGKNKVTTFMPIKKEIAYKPEESLEEIVKKDNTEEVDPKDIPF